MVYYTLTIFLSAFLLFALQPLMGKYLLPWFGGGALALSIFLLPIAPDASWESLGAESPTREIIFVFIVHVGLPFALLAATGPLLSRWFSRVVAAVEAMHALARDPAKDPVN